MRESNHIPTRQENLLANALKERNIELIQQYDDGHKTVDIFIPSAKLDIEVDGMDHFIKPTNILSDFKREYWSERHGYHTIHIPNLFVNRNDLLPQIVDALVEVVNQIREEMLVSKLITYIK